MTRAPIMELTPTMIEIEKRVNAISKPVQIAKELKISIGTYYNLLNKINERNNSSEFRAQYEEEITGTHKIQLLEGIKLYDQAKTHEEKCKALKLWNEILTNYMGFLFKTGRIKEVSKKVEITGTVNVDYNEIYQLCQENEKQQLPIGNIIEQERISGESNPE